MRRPRHARPARPASIASLVVVAAIVLAVPALVLAATTQQLVTRATGTWAMTCVASAGNQTCDRAATTRLPFALHAVISPASGEETNLITQALRGGATPTGGLSPGAFVAALGVFAVFGALSIGTWLFFRFRPKTEAA
ncbi:MAG TPA: hypothetical protein VM451_05895 [Candidatus Limnocylindria bacterium]|nr:hypothetical protein [Candidatus Limnocylindria bacterium]